MKAKLITPIGVALSLLTLASCVSTKKYKAMKAEAGRLRADSAAFSNRILSLDGSLSKSQMDQELTNSKLQKTNAELNSSNEQIAAQQARLAELQDRIERQRAATVALRKTIADALVNFNAEQLTVTTKNGKVYVSMSEKLLFPSGSAEVNPEGKDALSQLAKALNQNTDINIDVEGHTDTVPITKRFPDNWALSVARSTEITRILVKDYGVNPTRIIASGRSQYLPVADNSTPDGRARNRRTEIILEPKLDKIMELVEGASGN
ncbi:OmpA family protein [Rurimicrobium arvi]|uniref:OmpA family protein n=1 Tax=Rurimicrobium arvi TaxID=2049916 RepID=A0ABP8MII6_9BACT